MKEINLLFSLKDRLAIVTGALGLLGRQHCMALSQAGAHVVVADLNGENCQKFASTLPGPAFGISLDVTEPDSIEVLKDSVIKHVGAIDILINNAAINDMFESPKAALEKSKFEYYPLDLWKISIDVNITGVFLCCQGIGTEMAKRGKGSIINIASTYGMVGPDQSLYRDEHGNQSFYKPPAYSAGKGAVLSFTRYLAAYWGHTGVRVNSLSPGGVENNQDDYFLNSYSKKTSLGRMAHPQDYWGAIIFLASDASSYMTGANLVVDGGWTAW